MNQSNTSPKIYTRQPFDFMKLSATDEGLLIQALKYFGIEVFQDEKGWVDSSNPAETILVVKKGDDEYRKRR